jgi:hypothetical protein
MKILLICSARFENREAEFVEKLTEFGHEVLFTGGYDEPKLDGEVELDYGARMLRKSINRIKNVDAVLCLNFQKGDIKNYIGGATFAEMCYAFEHGKKIFILNDLPEDSELGAKVRFEIEMFRPIILKGKLEDVK